MNIQFERRTAGKLVLDSFVDIGGLDPAMNPIQEVCSRGFHLPEDGAGLEFPVGNIELPLDAPGM